MKKTTLLATLAIAGALQLHAQDSTKLERAGKAVDKAATKAANKTAATASKAKSAVVDQKYKDKVGPDGQTIFIDHSSKYYYVDDKGKKVYVKKSQLKDK